MSDETEHNILTFPRGPMNGPLPPPPPPEEIPPAIKRTLEEASRCDELFVIGLTESRITLLASSDGKSIREVIGQLEEAKTRLMGILLNGG